MNPHSSLVSATWYFKYLGIPLTVGVVMFSLCRSTERRRRAALEGKVSVDFFLKEKVGFEKVL